MKNKLKLFEKCFVVISFFLFVVLIVSGCAKKEDIVAGKAAYNPVVSNPTGGDTCDFKTFTQGGWGTTPHGNNPGTYQYKNFAGAFPKGLTVGCSTYSLTLTSAKAVSDFLPCGGPAAALKASYTNPTGLKNVFAGQLIALTLSVGFDKWDPAFAGSPLNLGDLKVSSGTFKGVTVNTILAEANNAIGGCQSKYSISDLTSILAAINENFDNGTMNNGILDCKSSGGGNL
jgi:hypothetical protein